MKVLETVAIVIALTAVSAAVVDYHPLSDEYIAEINKKAKTWKAGKNFEIHDWERVKKMSSGTLLRDSSYLKGLYKTNPHNEDDDVPESFDAREAWPKCDAIKQIRDQSSCGSCWAFGSSEAMSDRICIHSNQTKQIYVSAEDLTACCHGAQACGFGCDGGYMDGTWPYWKDTGIVTGGLYNSSQGCQDYSLEPCEHADPGSRPQCSDLHFDTPKCTKQCYDTRLNYKASKTYGQDPYMFTNDKQIQLEILKNGPVASAFLAYEDFPDYRSGVYQRTVSKVLGGHAIKIIGWGVEDGIPYWLVANSWNTDWGEEGFIKFLRGSNHCGIEGMAMASKPALYSIM